eukprot:UN23363
MDHSLYETSDHRIHRRGKLFYARNLVFEEVVFEEDECFKKSSWEEKGFAFTYGSSGYSTCYLGLIRTVTKNIVYNDWKRGKQRSNDGEDGGKDDGAEEGTPEGGENEADGDNQKKVQDKIEQMRMEGDENQRFSVRNAIDIFTVKEVVKVTFEQSIQNTPIFTVKYAKGNLPRK